MSEIREVLRRAAEGFDLPPDMPERAARRAGRRRRNRRVVAASLAIALSAATFWGLSAAFRSSSRTTPAAACPRTWTSMQAPDLPGPGGFSSVSARAPDDVWAVGPGEEAVNNEDLEGSRPVVGHWDGTSWTSVPSPDVARATTSEFVSVAAIAPDDVWAVGDWDTGDLAGGHAVVHVLVEHWDGSSWSVVAAPDPSSGENRLMSVAAVAPDDAWVVGFGTGGNVAVPLVEHWDGSSWSIVPTPDVTGPNDGAVLNGVAAFGPDDVWAVGSARGGTLTEHWDGVRWAVVESPSVGRFPDEYSSLQSIHVVSPDDAWAVGSHFSTGSPPGSENGVTVVPLGTLVEHWDGTRWTIVDSPDVPDRSSYLTSVGAAGPDDVWAVGASRPRGDARGSKKSALVEHWNGSGWRIVAGAAGVEGGDLLGVTATDGGELWAVGAGPDGGPMILSGSCR